MKISLGAVITEKRKEKKVTQQELADFVGVSKAAVSKWETGQTYPDITLLPLLAAYFDVSIDSLLDYEPELNQQEIQRIYLSLQKSFQTKSAEEVLQSIESFIHRYYSCYPFLLQMGNLLLNHYDLLPGENPLEKQQRYIPKALDLFIRVRSNSKEVAVMDEAMKMQAYCLLILNRPDDVLAILGEYVPPYLPSDSLIAGAFQLKGATDQALATTQSGIFQNLFVLLSGLTNYLPLLVKEPIRFTETYQRGAGLITLFQAEKINPAALLNFYLSAAVGYAQIGDKAALFAILEKVCQLLEINPVLQFMPDDYFDCIQEWLNTQALAGQTPREANTVVESVIAFILTNPLLLPYREEEKMREIFQRIEKVKEERKNERK